MLSSEWTLSCRKFYKKNEYSEWVIRNTLYWMSSITRWKLDDNEQTWIVSFELFNDQVDFEFERLLNDYKLREKLQEYNGHVRASIIDNVLRSIDSRLAQ